MLNSSRRISDITISISLIFKIVFITPGLRERENSNPQRKKMATALQSLSKLFTDRLFRIPDYQRGYAWGQKQIADFWNDLVNLEEEKKHYAGVITLEEVLPAKWKTWETDTWLIKSKGFTPYHVVDGQQRFTTSIILIQCFIESMGQVSQKLNHNTAKEIQKRYIYDSPDSQVSKTYIFGYESDNPSYEYLNQVIFKENSNPRNLDETAYTANLDFAKNFFHGKLAKLDAPTKDRLFKNLTQSIVFNTYEIESEIDVFVAFETMNNRGKPLSHLELLKNRLIYLSTRLTSYSVSEKTSLLSQINHSWRSVYHHLGRNKQKLMEDDKFLFTHSLLYFADVFVKGKKDSDTDYLRLARYARKDYQYRLIEEIFTQGNLCQKTATPDEREKLIFPVDIVAIHKYVTNLKNSVELWFDIFNPTLSAYTDDEKLWLDRLNRVNGMSVAPLVLAFFEREKSPQARVNLLKALERTLFVVSIYGFQYHYTGGDIFINLAIELVLEKTTPERVVKQVEGIIPESSYTGLGAQFKVIAKSSEGFYGWTNIRYFLYEYEQFLRTQTKTERNKISWEELIDPPIDHVTVEHIYPQKATDASWTMAFGAFTPREKKILRHSLGNLLPLSRAKNSSLQNKSFELKKAEREKFIGFHYGSLSENEVARETSWNAVTILTRGTNLLKFAQKRWNLDLGDESKIAQMLALEFVEKRVLLKTKKAA